MVDGVAKNRSTAFGRIAQCSTCLMYAPLGRNRHASESRKLAYLYIELLCIAISSVTMDFLRVHQRGKSLFPPGP